MANKLIVYDALNNKMVFNLLRGRPELVWDAGFISNTHGLINHSTNPPQCYWFCGTANADYVISYEEMKVYFPLDAPFGISISALSGFTVTELLNRSYLTIGTSKKFYTNKEKTDYIEVLVQGSSTNAWGHTVYNSVRFDARINGTTYNMISHTAGSSVLDAGLCVAPFNNNVGIFPFWVDEKTVGSNMRRELTLSVTSTVATRYLYDGTLPVDQIPTDPDNTLPIGGYGNISDMTGDDIELPTAPDESVSGVLASGFLNIYKPSDSDLRAFGGALWTNAFNVKWYDIDSVANLVMNAVSDPINFIIGLFMLPVSPSTSGSSGIYLGGLNNAGIMVLLFRSRETLKT